MSTVLCLDDFTCSLTEATHVLRANGYEVLAADENTRALELAAEKPLDAVFLNCHRDATSTTIVRRCRCVMRSDRLRSYKLPTCDLREIFSVPELFRDVTSVVCVMLPRRRRQSCITRSLVELDGVKVLLICMRRGARSTEHGTSARITIETLTRWKRVHAAARYLRA